MADAVRPVFRRATPEDAFDLARETFLADERVDMQTLAAQLGVARATLHRWVQTRENLIDQVLGGLAHVYFTASRAQAKGRGDRVITETARIMVIATVSFQPLRGFIEREPELALRLLLGERYSVRRNLVERLRALIEEVLPDEAEQLRGFADAYIEVALALTWPMLVAGDEPSAQRLVQIARALLAGARAGELDSFG